MTRLFFACTLALLLTGCATTAPPSSYEYQDVIEVDASAEQIYDRTLMWMAERFVSSQDAIQLKDEENRRIVANARQTMKVGSLGTSLPVEMTLMIEARENRFRFTGRNFTAEYQMGSAPLAKSKEDEVQEELEVLAQELAIYIVSESASEDW